MVSNMVLLQILASMRVQALVLRRPRKDCLRLCDASPAEQEQKALHRKSPERGKKTGTRFCAIAAINIYPSMALTTL
jgi:hypothetical protein